VTASNEQDQASAWRNNSTGPMAGYSDLAFVNLSESRTFMHRKVVRLIALYQILRLFLRSVNRVAFERDFGGMLFLDRPSDTSGFRVPFHVISHFKIVCHRRYLLLPFNRTPPSTASYGR
jgi:hypothetical protein